MLPEIYQIIDVNINRSREALRILEDIARFYLVKEDLMLKIRNIRHSIQNYEKKYLLKNYILYRNSLWDIGKEAKPVNKFTLMDLIKANFKRLQESLRVLEECSNLINTPPIFFQNLRFKTYDLEKLFFHKEKFPKGIYLITDDTLTPNKTINLVDIALKKGVQIIQLRDKKRKINEILIYGKKIAENCRKHNALFFVNDRIDIALELRADGMHLGSTDISPNLIKKIAPHLIIGISVDTLNEAKKILKNKIPVDYIALGPIFNTQTKTNLPSPRGLKMLKDLVKISSLPVVAIGGINQNNIASVIDCKVHNIAMISAFSKAKNVSIFLDKIIKYQRLKNIA